MDIISTDNLGKKFGKVIAVDGINIRIGKGEIYGFLGLNGAGKTTTIRMLLGMLRPSSGNSYLKDVKVSPGNYNDWNNVGYLVEIPYSYPDLTVLENLEIICRLRLLPDYKAIDTVLDQLNLREYKDRLAKNLSLGNKQRLGLAKAILHKPEILILDEPANGLDPAGIVEIRELLKDLAYNKGVTILVSSHILGEIAKFASRIGIIHRGKMVQEIESKDLTGFLKRKLHIKLQNYPGAILKLENTGYKVKDLGNQLLEVIGKDALSNPELVNRILVEAGFAPSMIKVEEEDLETYFLRVIGNNI